MITVELEVANGTLTVHLGVAGRLAAADVVGNGSHLARADRHAGCDRRDPRRSKRAHLPGRPRLLRHGHAFDRPRRERPGGRYDRFQPTSSNSRCRSTPSAARDVRLRRRRNVGPPDRNRGRARRIRFGDVRHRPARSRHCPPPGQSPFSTATGWSTSPSFVFGGCRPERLPCVPVLKDSGRHGQDRRHRLRLRRRHRRFQRRQPRRSRRRRRRQQPRGDRPADRSGRVRPGELHHRNHEPRRDARGRRLQRRQRARPAGVERVRVARAGFARRSIDLLLGNGDGAPPGRGRSAERARLRRARSSSPTSTATARSISPILEPTAAARGPTALSWCSATATARSPRPSATTPRRTASLTGNSSPPISTAMACSIWRSPTSTIHRELLGSGRRRRRQLRAAARIRHHRSAVRDRRGRS